MESGAGRETLAVGTSWSWELSLSLGGKLQIMDVLLSATVSKSEGDKKKGFLPEHEGGKQC